MKILFLSVLMALIVLVIPNVYAESYDEWKSNRDGGNASFSTHEERFEALSSWASDNKDILGKDVSFHVENRGTMKADFTVSNVSLISLEKEFHYNFSPSDIRK